MKINKVTFLLTASILTIGLLITNSCKNGMKQPSAFELTGTLTDAGEGAHIYLDRLLPNDSVQHLDSATIGKQGDFSFHTPGIYKGFYSLRITPDDYAILILDSNEKVAIGGNAQNLGYTYKVSGSPDSRFYLDFNIRLQEKRLKLDSLKKHADAAMSVIGNNPKRMDSLADAIEGPFDTIIAQYNRYIESFIKTNLNSFACLPAIQSVFGDSMVIKNISYYTMLDSALTKQYPGSAYVKPLHDKTESLKRVAIGVMAPDIILPDTSGNMVSLSRLRGKVVLIDFWASWCKPCKESLPGLLEIYNRYKNNNFTVFSVSLDKIKDQWTGAIKKFNLPWTQVSELKYWDSKVVSLYDFNGIPFTVLISTDGKIIDKNLNDTELESILQKLLANPKT